MARLASFVYVQDEHGVSVGFGPGDVVPPWAAAQITNPKAWADSVPAAVAAPAAHVVAPKSDPAAPTGADAPTQPPKNGPGSSRDAWAAYAASMGIEIKPGTAKADIIAEVEHGRAAG